MHYALSVACALMRKKPLAELGFRHSESHGFADDDFVGGFREFELYLMRSCLRHAGPKAGVVS